MENIHSGHRSRLRERFTSHGLEALSDVEALEMLLYFALPRRDTNAIAHALMNRFGSFRAVLEADESELCTVPGIGESAALLIRLVREIDRRYLISRKNDARRLIRSTTAAGEYAMPLFAYTNREMTYAISLGSGGSVICCHRLAGGMGNSVEFSAREIVDLALRDKAAYLILAHNHLSDTALPSRLDISTTKKLRTALALVGITLFDHIIVCDNDFVSLRDSGYFQEPPVTP